MTGMSIPGSNTQMQSARQSDLSHDGDENLSFSSALEAQVDEESPNYGKFENNRFVSTWTKDKADELLYGITPWWKRWVEQEKQRIHQHFEEGWSGVVYLQRFSSWREAEGGVRFD